jgi:uncharacterized SAM-dependent methyltransferase
MLYFKHAELAKKYRVSLRTVHNWIEAAKASKLDLTLHHEGNKVYIANNAKNTAVLGEITESRRKYRNTKAVKTVTPSAQFYDLYSQKQIHDIVTNLEIHHEVPRQYNYFDGGAGNWDKYAKRMAAENSPNLLTGTIRLLDINANYISDLISRYKRVNVVDVGIGNALPLKSFVGELVTRGVMGRYIGIDISSEMLRIAGQNVKAWFGDKLSFETHELDINYDRFADILAQEYIKEDAADTINLIFVLGGTLCNFRAPGGAFKVVHDSMGIRDVLIHTQKLDTPGSRQYFDFNTDPQGTDRLAPNHRLMFDLLGVDESFYDVERGFDEKTRQRYIRARLRIALNINFEFEGGQRTLSFNKGDAILLFRYWHQDAVEAMRQLDKNDFYMLHSSQTEDMEYILTISRVKQS